MSSPASEAKVADQISSLLQAYAAAEESGGRTLETGGGDGLVVNPELDEAFHKLVTLARGLQQDAVAEAAFRFPSLQQAEGVRPLDADLLQQWLQKAPTPAAEHAGRFVLSLLRSDEDLFDLRKAFEAWDAEHQQAYVAWVKRPVVPQLHLWGA